MTFEWGCMGLSIPLDVVPPGPGSLLDNIKAKTHSVAVTRALTRPTYWGDSLPHTTLWYSGPKLISSFKKTLGVFHCDGVYLHVGMKYGEVRRRKGLYMCMCVCEREKSAWGRGGYEVLNVCSFSQGSVWGPINLWVIRKWITARLGTLTLRLTC